MVFCADSTFGSPAALYLAAAGVGTLGIVDDDVVDLTNLQRQVIHNTERIGEPKVESARKTIEALNPDVEVIGYQTRLDQDNVLDLIRDYDVIVDGADNFPTRYLLNDASLMARKPLVHASILRFEGQSDPGDMSILFALRTPSGARGTYSAPFGSDTPPEDADVIARMQHQAGDGTLDG